jgi:hypothetical protein
MSRLAESQLSFADLELRNQGVHLDPLLQGILAFLDDHATLVEQNRNTSASLHGHLGPVTRPAARDFQYRPFEAKAWAHRQGRGAVL